MKNKTVILILSVLAVAMYTTAVINFCLGNVLDGITGVLMASFGALMAYSLYHVGQLGRLADRTGKAVIGLLEQLTKGVPATLTVKDGKGTVTLGHDEDDDRDPGEAPEEELSDEEKRKMLEEIARLNEENAKLTAERDREAEKAKAFASHVTHDMKWLPTVEQIKSVYASAGVMEQMHEPTDAKHLMSLWEDLKRIHSANADANVAAGKAEDPDDE
jgi:hypothetical protein